MGLVLSSIEVSGIGSYGPDPQRLELDGRGPVALIGDNGSGKSTLISKALTWGLYGKTTPERMGSGTRSLSGKAICNKDCDSAVVQIELSNEKDRYRIIRSRKRTGSDVVDVSVSHNSGPYESLEPTAATIESIVGADWFVFCRTVVRGQGDLWSFSEATDRAKRDLLDVISGAIVLERMEARAKSLLRIAENTTKQHDMMMTSAQQKLTSRDPDRYSEKVIQWDRKQENLIEQVLREVDLAMEAEQEAIEHDKFLEVRKESYDVLLRSKPSLDRKVYTDTLRKAEGVYDTVSRAYQERIGEGNRLREVAENGVCTTCGQDVSESAPISKRAKEVEVELAELKTKNDTASKYRADCNQAFEDAEAWLRREDQGWQKRLTEFGSIPSAQGAQATRYRKEVQARCSGLMDQVNPYIEALKNEMEQVAELNTEIEHHKQEKERTIEGASLARVWTDVLSPRGVRAHLAESALSQIEQKANEWLSILSDGRLSVEFPPTREVSGQVKDDIKTIVSMRSESGDVEIRDLLTFSGGERRRVNLAVDLGVASACSFGDLELSLLVLDEEVFSGMDEMGKAGVVRSLHGAGLKDIVIIDHDPRLSAALPRTVKIERGPDGFSRVSECV